MQPKSADTPSQVRSGVNKLLIDEGSAGQRIDNFLRRELPGVPKGRLYRMLRKGEVRVNGGRIKAEYRLVEGDEVRVPPVSVRVPSQPDGRDARDLEQHIIYEDKRLLVINKPSGIAVHGGSGVSHGVIELLRAARPDLADLSLVHRLDRDTSGCLVIAKRRSALRQMHALFRDGVVEKNYMALVLGDWQHGDIVVDAPLEVRHRQGGERHVIVSADGKPARTRIGLARRYGNLSLVRCQPLTGRTHQIRVHACHAGHPLAGDTRYGDEDWNRRLEKQGLKRLFLHAQSIAFPDTSGNEQHFTAPMSPELDRFLATLKPR